MKIEIQRPEWDITPDRPDWTTSDYEIFWHKYDVIDEFNGQKVHFEGWSHTNHRSAIKGFVNPVGIFEK